MQPNDSQVDEEEVPLGDLHERISGYDFFLRRVQGDRETAERLHSNHIHDIQTWDDIEQNLSRLMSGGGEAPVLPVSLGAGVSMKAEINPKIIYLSIGLGFHLGCTLDEAPRVIKIKRDQSTNKAKEAQAAVEKIKQQEALIKEGLIQLKRMI